MSKAPTAPTRKEVEEHLEVILVSDKFTASPRLKDFLRFIVEETISGNAGQVKAYTIATSILGRGNNFDPQRDPVVRIEAAKLRNKLMEYYYSCKEAGPLRINLPKGSYIPTFAFEEEETPLSLSHKTAHKTAHEMPHEMPYEMPYEMTESEAFADSARSLQKETEPRPFSQSPQFSQFSQFSQSPQFSQFSHLPHLSQLSVAVLSFKNLSGDGEKDYFINGLAEEITIALTRFEDINIVSSHSTRNISSHGEDIASIAHKLGVRFVLHGSVQFNNNNIRVRAELTDAETGSNIWAERFDSSMSASELFSIQDKITSKVVSRIGDGFGSIKRKLMRESSGKRTDDLEVYEAMLRYHHWLPTFDVNFFKQAVLALEKAIDREPNYATPIAMLADLYASDYQLGYNTIDNALEKAKEFSSRAISLDSSSQTAHWALALTLFLQGEAPQFREAINQIVPLNPADSYMLIGTALLMGLAGNEKESFELIEKALSLNPHSPTWYKIVYFSDYYMKESYEDALAEALAINTPSCFWEPMLKAAAYGQLGRSKEAALALNELLSQQPTFNEDYKKFIKTIFFLEGAAQKVEEGILKAGFVPEQGK